jgi:hypothetical protein
MVTALAGVSPSGAGPNPLGNYFPPARRCVGFSVISVVQLSVYHPFMGDNGACFVGFR